MESQESKDNEMLLPEVVIDKYAELLESDENTTLAIKVQEGFNNLAILSELQKYKEKYYGQKQ